MIVGYHVIFGAYGFWLPNDPRGSWSEFVGMFDLYRYGPATKTTETRSVSCTAQPRPASLNSPPKHRCRARRCSSMACKLGPLAKALLCMSSARNCRSGRAHPARPCSLGHWSCPHRCRAGGDSTERRSHEQLGRARVASLRFADGQDGTTTQVFRPPRVEGVSRSARRPATIGYCEGNPLKEGKPRQRWSFVTPYPGLG